MGSVVELRTELLRAEEVAEILGLGRSKVYEMMAAGLLGCAPRKICARASSAVVRVDRLSG